MQEGDFKKIIYSIAVRKSCAYSTFEIPRKEYLAHQNSPPQPQLSTLRALMNLIMAIPQTWHSA